MWKVLKRVAIRNASAFLTILEPSFTANQEHFHLPKNSCRKNLDLHSALLVPNAQESLFVAVSKWPETIIQGVGVGMPQPMVFRLIQRL